LRPRRAQGSGEVRSPSSRCPADRAPRSAGLHGQDLVQQKPIRRSMIQPGRARSVPSPVLRHTQSGRAVLAVAFPTRPAASGSRSILHRCGRGRPPDRENPRLLARSVLNHVLSCNQAVHRARRLPRADGSSRRLPDVVYRFASAAACELAGLAFPLSFARDRLPARDQEGDVPSRCEPAACPGR